MGPATTDTVARSAGADKFLATGDRPPDRPDKVSVLIKPFLAAISGLGG